MSLTADELVQLTDLLTRMDNTQLRGPAWKAYVRKCWTPAIELCILDGQGRMFFSYRKDDEFEGSCFPGTVINDWETPDEAMHRLLTKPNNEIGKFGLSPLTLPRPIGWVQAPRGNGPGDNPTRNTLSLLHVARFSGQWKSTEERAGFYPFTELPHDILGTHRFLTRFFERYAVFGDFTFGK